MEEATNPTSNVYFDPNCAGLQVLSGEKRELMSPTKCEKWMMEKISNYEKK